MQHIHWAMLCLTCSANLGNGSSEVLVALLLPRLWGLLGLLGGSGTLPTTNASASQPPIVLQLQQQQCRGSWSTLSLWSVLLWQMKTQFSNIYTVKAKRLGSLALWLSSPWSLETLQSHRGKKCFTLPFLICLPSTSRTAKDSIV